MKWLFAIWAFTFPWVRRPLTMREYLCETFAEHDWDKFSYGKRRCRRCAREEWLMTTPYPAIGEPKSHWDRVPALPLKYL